MRKTIALTLILMAVGCGEDATIEKGATALRTVKVTAAEYGDKWPLKAKEAILYCEEGRRIMKVDGKLYGLNGPALSAGLEHPTKAMPTPGGVADFIEKAGALCETSANQINQAKISASPPEENIDLPALARETEEFIESNHPTLVRLTRDKVDRITYNRLIYRPALEVYRKWPTPSSRLPDSHYVYCASWLNLYMTYADDYFKSGGKGVQSGENLMKENRSECRKFLKKLGK
ncbi:MAG: YebY family protein [Candidatus Accumulibacter sp.]|jgi:hypothetical protein|nr:YebY family protein [Accumulibacter sp.]